MSIGWGSGLGGRAGGQYYAKPGISPSQAASYLPRVRREEEEELGTSEGELESSNLILFSLTGLQDQRGHGQCDDHSPLALSPLKPYIYVHRAKLNYW